MATIDWHQLADNDVIRTLGELIRRQLNVWLGYLGPSGMLAPIGLRQAVDKPLCEAFMSRHDAESCHGSICQWFDELASAPNADGCRNFRCHAGLSAMLAPISVRGKVIAAVYASGFLLPSQENAEEELLRRGKKLGFQRGLLQHGIRELLRLSQREQRLLGELLQLLAGESLRTLGHTQELELPEEAHGRHDYAQIIGQSAAMQQLFGLLDKVVESDATVLIQGDPGVGKELVARAIHFNSWRRNEPFVVQNCSALNDSLLDSELFGHRRGSFTGAISDKQGLFELADRGTFFLDEIGDMSPMLQVKLLRVLQEGTFLPVGDTVVRKVDVRIIAATHRDLKQMVKDGSFRSDLFFRLNVINIEVPSLRQRAIDIPQLVSHFISIKCAENRHSRKSINPDAMDLLCRYEWPGNVRELENEVERLVVLSGFDKVIPASLLSPRIRNSAGLAPTPIPIELNPNAPKKLPEALEQLERHMILESLKRTNWNKTQTAAELDISRRNLIRKVKEYELDAARPSK
ncbi:MAG: sigma 54-interacting transcriptional regulator [Myxococcota bacterium]|jgi:transcriptional regulator with GAF, ATPase, and Fis domain|nr:sigma 54-interacting transcriptional regulator [Myxococcota bacterium]